MIQSFSDSSMVVLDVVRGTGSYRIKKNRKLLALYIFLALAAYNHKNALQYVPVLSVIAFFYCIRLNILEADPQLDAVFWMFQYFAITVLFFKGYFRH